MAISKPLIASWLSAEPIDTMHSRVVISLTFRLCSNERKRIGVPPV